MRKTILFTALLAFTTSYADTIQCPTPICQYYNGKTICSNLAYGWEVEQGLPKTATTPQLYNHFSEARYDKNSVKFNDIKCYEYTSLPANTDMIVLDRIAGTQMLYPDMSDQWGWAWASVDKSTAVCTAAACVLTTVAPR
jgi:hypothetical protein